jgi:flagellar hook-associated protein 3 FlgL
MSSAFRITQRTVNLAVMSNLQGNLSKMQRLQEQLSSGRTLNRPSDSPTDAVAALRFRSDIRRGEQLARNAQDGLSWLGTADTTLMQTMDVTRRSKELLLRATSAGADDTARKAIAAELDGLREAVLGLANTTYLGRPIFGGATSQPLAYDATGAYVGDTGAVKRSVAPGLDVQVNLAGTDVFGAPGSDMFSFLEDAATALRAGALDDARTAFDGIEQVATGIQNAVALIGSRTNQIEKVKERVEAGNDELTTRLSEVESIDLPKTIIELQMQEVAYQAALGATAKILQPSLVDFLR